MTAGRRVCLIGFGEVGQTLATDLLARGGCEIAAYDLLFQDPASAPSRAAAALRVRVAKDPDRAATGADVVVSAVTAAQDLNAARSTSPGLERGAFFLDLNSVSPGVKQQAAQIVAAAGGRYVESAIMAPIAPQRSASPMLLGGAHAAAFLTVAHELGFAGPCVFSDRIGPASAAKMCRSVVIKGMEALLAESLLTARCYGVETTVVHSLQDLFPSLNWSTLSRYMISRSLIHGRRRAEEMHEVARTIAEAGLQPSMSLASALRQEWAADFRSAAAHEELAEMLDAVLCLARPETSQC